MDNNQNKQYLDYEGLKYLLTLLATKDELDETNIKVDNATPISHTTNEWEQVGGDTVPANGQVVVYSDYQTVVQPDGSIKNVPNIKIGDGVTPVTELSFIYHPYDPGQVKLQYALKIGPYTYDGSKEVVIPTYEGEYNN